MTVRCDAFIEMEKDRSTTTCLFTNVTFNQDTKLNIVHHALPGINDENFEKLRFEYASIFLLHRDILAKFPNAKIIHLSYKLNNPKKLQNCQDITDLVLSLSDFTGFSSDTFEDCEKLETLLINFGIKFLYLTDLPNGLFRNQGNLRSLKLLEKNLKLRVRPFEGLKNLSQLKLHWMDLSKMEENFFHSFKIKKLHYGGERRYTFPIESLNSHETIEELRIEKAELSPDPENLGPVLRSMKQLKIIDFRINLIGSVEAFVDLPNVEEIVLMDNKIEEIPANAFKGCPRLTKLNLNNNPIKVLRGDEFNQLSELKELFLWRLELTSLAPTTFHPLKSLEQLYLGYSFAGQNNIIGKELFMHSTNLKKLDLSWSRIEAIHPEAFDNLHKLTFLGLRGNRCVYSDFQVFEMNSVRDKFKKCFENFSGQETL
jgi:Leucine-rich repeat (LRR) protein